MTSFDEILNYYLIIKSFEKGGFSSRSFLCCSKLVSYSQIVIDFASLCYAMDIKRLALHMSDLIVSFLMKYYKLMIILEVCYVFFCVHLHSFQHAERIKDSHRWNVTQECSSIGGVAFKFRQECWRTLDLQLLTVSQDDWLAHKHM